MAGQLGHFNMSEAWDRASASYLERRGNNVTWVSYGNLAPDESQLRLLGNLQGKRVLDFGCGGGQNAVACARHGAHVTGIDISSVQLRLAHNLALEYEVKVDWQEGDIGSGSLGLNAGEPFDLILAIQVLPYVSEPVAMLRQMYALLRAGGFVILSVDHPFRNCFFDEEMDDLVAYPVRNYCENSVMKWRFAANVPMRSYHRSIGEWLKIAFEAGFRVDRLIEAAAPSEICDELWPVESALEPLRNIPHTLIIQLGRA